MIGEVGLELEGDVSFPSLESGHGLGYFCPASMDRLRWTGIGTKQIYSCGGFRMGLSLLGFKGKSVW